jgi:hypothetical protein
MDWQPIETAPKVDSYALRQMQVIGAWKHRTLGWQWGRLERHRHTGVGAYYLAAHGEPTHWAVLPMPASEQEPQP